MVYIHTKNPNLGTFWRALEFKIFYGQLVFSPFWYVVPLKNLATQKPIYISYDCELQSQRCKNATSNPVRFVNKNYYLII
jgi:hypothetical protein